MMDTLNRSETPKVYVAKSGSSSSVLMILYFMNDKLFTYYYSPSLNLGGYAVLDAPSTIPTDLLMAGLKSEEIVSEKSTGSIQFREDGFVWNDDFIEQLDMEFSFTNRA